MLLKKYNLCSDYWAGMRMKRVYYIRGLSFLFKKGSGIRGIFSMIFLNKKKLNSSEGSILPHPPDPTHPSSKYAHE